MSTDGAEVAVAVATLTEQVRQMELRGEERADLVTKGMESIRDEVRSDLGALNESVTRQFGLFTKSVERMAEDVATIRDKVQDPVSGVIRVQQDHADRIRRVELWIDGVRKSVRKAGLWLLVGILGFVATVLLKFAPEMGKWLAEAGQRVGK